MKKNFKKTAAPARLAIAVTLGASLLSACGGSDGLSLTPPILSNDLPAGLTQLGGTAPAYANA